MSSNEEKNVLYICGYMGHDNTIEMEKTRATQKTKIKQFYRAKDYTPNHDFQ